MNGYEKRAKKKREEIIEAAQCLLLQNGITNTTIEQIAEMARASRVTVFKYFGDKKGLVEEVVRIWANLIMQEYRKIVESDQPFHAKVKQIVKGLEQIGASPVTVDIRRNNELMKTINEIIKESGLPKIIELIEAGKKAGVIDPSLENDAILIYFSAFSRIVSDPNYIMKDKIIHNNLFNMFMGGLIMNWYSLDDCDDS